MLLPIWLIIIHFTKWKMLISSLKGYLFLGILFSLYSLLLDNYFFTNFGIVLLFIFILSQYFILYEYGQVWKSSKASHIIIFWFAISVISLEFFYYIFLPMHNKTIIYILLIIVPFLATLLILIPKHYKGWLEAYRPTYQLVGAGGLIAFMLFISFILSSLTSNASGYIPLLNLLDMTQVSILGIFYYWIYQNHQKFPLKIRKILYAMSMIFITVLINIIFARFVHHSQEIAYSTYSLWHNGYFQMGLSILWSSIAIILMLLSKKYQNRPLWIAGFGILILVVLKLFFIELAQSGTIERIVSFMVVGTLLLLIGYFVPLPPSEEKTRLSI
jgi:uncharacterized membrane protein